MHAMRLYECWGGPKDGDFIELDPYTNIVRYPLPLPHVLGSMTVVDEYIPAPPTLMRYGIYRLREHRKSHTFYLVWEGEE